MTHKPLSFFRSRTFGAALARSSAWFFVVAALAGFFAYALAGVSERASQQRALFMRQLAQEQQAVDLRKTLEGRQSLVGQIDGLVPNLSDRVDFHGQLRGAASAALGGGAAVDIGSPAPHETVNGVYTVPFSIRGVGTAEAVRDALAELEALPFLLRVIRASIDVTDSVIGAGSVTLSGEFFVRTEGAAASR